MAREVATGTLGTGSRLASTIAAWRRALLIALVVVTACSVLLREPIARPARRRAVVGRGRDALDRLPVAAALDRARRAAGRARLPRGRLVDRARGVGRLVSGLLLVAVGLGVTGAYLGTPVSMVVTAVVLIAIARRRIGVADPRTPRPRAARPGRRRLAGRDRAVPRRRAAERRRDPRQAHDRRRRRRRLRRGRGGGQGGRVGGDRRRPLPAARGDAQGAAPARTRGPCCCARSASWRRSPCRCCSSTRSRRRSCCGSRSARRPSRPRARCSCSGSR